MKYILETTTMVCYLPRKHVLEVSLPKHIHHLDGQIQEHNFKA